MPLFGPSQFTSARETKLSQRRSALERASKALTAIPEHPKENLILSTPAQELTQKIRDKEWTSLMVVAAFARRCLATQEDLNCLTEGIAPGERLNIVMIAEALERAKELDEYQEKNGNTIGPLHGVPFTLKDTFNVQGYDSSLGISQFVGKPYQKSSALYTALTNLGGVLLAKTNIPQTLLAFECNNPIFGQTHNPCVKGFTCGGSSGGEGVVLARNATALGFGTDIGGSLRIPAGWCGIYSLKPTKGRFTANGIFSTAELCNVNESFESRP